MNEWVRKLTSANNWTWAWAWAWACREMSSAEAVGEETDEEEKGGGEEFWLVGIVRESSLTETGGGGGGEGGSKRPWSEGVDHRALFIHSGTCFFFFILLFYSRVSFENCLYSTSLLLQISSIEEDKIENLRLELEDKSNIILYSFNSTTPVAMACICNFALTPLL